MPAARLLFVVNDTPYFALHWLDRARAALAAGYDVHVAGSPGAGVDVLRASALHFHAIPFKRGRSTPWRELRSLSALLPLYRSLAPEIVHHVTIKPVIYGTAAARIRRVPAVVNTVPGLGYVFAKRGLAAAIARAAVRTLYRATLGHPNSRVIFENPDDRADFLRWGLVSAGRGLVIKGAGVDLGRFRPAKRRSTGPPVVLLAARMLWEKGLAEFVAAARETKRTHPEARFVLVGTTDPGNVGSIDEAQLRAWQAEGVVEAWGQRDDMPSLLADAAIVCLPSFYREGIPRVLIEAAACGRPAITTDTPGCREIVHDGVNGVLVPPRDVPRLVAAIRRLLDDPELGDRMGIQGRLRAEAEFGSERVISQTLEVYAGLLSRAASGRRSATRGSARDRTA